MTESTTNGQRMVVSIDFSDPSVAALDEALRRLAERPGSELHLVHAVESPGGVSNTTKLRNEDVLLSELPERLRALVRERIEALGATPPPSHVGIHVRFGPVVEAVLQMTVDADANLLIVGTHGRSGVKHAVMGSVAEQLVRRARCPVLVARAKDYAGLSQSDKVQPPCPDCVARRKETDGKEWWCELHARQHVESHTYSDVGPAWTRGMADVHGFGAS